MKKSLLTVFLLSSLFSYSQTEIVFEYDEAGNQIYRGTQKTNTTTNNTTQSNTPSNLNAGMSAEEIEFWSKIQLAPIPVREHLNIRITEDVKIQLNQITIHGHNSLGSTLFSIERRSIRANEININMSSYHFGIYVINFHLNNGKVFSRNISKH